MMKISRIAAIALLGCSVPLVQAETTDLDLEPCINGGVSASGNFASQQAADAHNEYVAHDEYADEYALEPCINGTVSASGIFPTQALEVRAQGGISPAGIGDSYRGIKQAVHLY